jgi:hypothetical protein
MIDINLNTDTSLNLTSDKYKIEVPADLPKSNLSSSASTFENIAFPISRTVMYSKDKTVAFSVDYKKIATQLEIFNANQEDF